MNSYPYTPWFIGGLGVAILVAFGVMAYMTWRRTYVPWKPLPNYYPGAKWHSLVQTDPKYIAMALAAAESALIQHTKWTAANMALVGHYVHVYVMDSESWVDLWGRKVAGYQDGHKLVVGPSLAALAHELAHLAELVLDGVVDQNHMSWPADGIANALEDYDQWLAKQASADRILAANGAIVPFVAPKVLTGMSACRYRRPE